MATSINGVGSRNLDFITSLPGYAAGLPFLGIPAEVYLAGDIIYEGNSVFVATTTTSLNPVGDQSGDWIQLDVNATQWFDGFGSPLVGLPNGDGDGDPGDFYVNNDNGDVFRKLDDNTWPSRKVLQFNDVEDAGFVTTTKFSPAAVPVDSGTQTSTITVTIADNFLAESMDIVTITNHAGAITSTLMTPVTGSGTATHHKQFTYVGSILTNGNTASTWTMRPTNVIYSPTSSIVLTPGNTVATLNILDITTNSRNVFYRGWVPNSVDAILTSQAANNLIMLDAQLDNDEQAITLGTNFQTDADEFDPADSSYCVALPTSIGVHEINAIINLNGEQRIPLMSITSRTVQTIPASNGYSVTGYTFFLIDTRSSVFNSLDHVESQQLEVV